MCLSVPAGLREASEGRRTDRSVSADIGLCHKDRDKPEATNLSSKERQRETRFRKNKSIAGDDRLLLARKSCLAVLFHTIIFSSS